MKQKQRLRGTCNSTETNSKSVATMLRAVGTVIMLSFVRCASSAVCRNVAKVRTVVLCLLLLATGSTRLWAQRPGNTTHVVEYWMRADKPDGVTNANLSGFVNNSNLDAWTSTGNLRKFVAVNSATTVPPKLMYAATNGTDGLNFNPAVVFAGKSRLLIGRESSAPCKDPDCTGVNGRTNKYCAFWVSKFTGMGTSMNTVFSFDGNKNNNNDEGWIFNGSPMIRYYNNSGNAYNKASKPYGIVSTIRSTSSITVYRNAKHVDMQSNLPFLYDGPAWTLSIGAGWYNNNNGTNPFTGNIQELILLSTGKNNSFDGDEIRKINSYLAIKYGQVLDTVAQPNLYNSENKEVWKCADNQGYNNYVFGIARDDKTDLYQKQSVSVEDKSLVVFVGNEIKPLSMQNNGSLDDMTYLLIGSNAKTGIEQHIVLNGTKFENKTLNGEFFHIRHLATYRLRLTKATGGANARENIGLKIDNGLAANYVMVSSHPDFVPARTRIFAVDADGTAKNVNVKDGDYFCFVMADGVSSVPVIAVDDPVTLGPLQTVIVDVLRNDICGCATPTMEILSSIDPGVGTAEILLPDKSIRFVAALGAAGSTVEIPYRVSCGISATSATAKMVIRILKNNNPVNVLSNRIDCFEPMEENIRFGVREKFTTKNGTERYNTCIDVGSSPMVGDLNGDGKPEIVVMGVSNDRDYWYGNITYRFVYIYNGQTGAEMYKYDLGSDFDMGDIHHRAPSSLALADLDNDGTGEIVVATHDGKVRALKPVFDGSKITGMNVAWTSSKDYGSPLTSSKSIYGYPHPYIADIDGDGNPEVIIYNKIYNGQTGHLLMSWGGTAATPKASSIAAGTLKETNYENPATATDATALRNSAMTGRRPGKGSESDHFLSVPAIVDIDGDGQQEIICGNRIHKFKFNSTMDHTQNTYTTIDGPLSVDLPVSTDASPKRTEFYLSDGFTRVADIDGDGELDVIVAGFANDGNKNVNILLYVWDPKTLQLKAANTFYSNGEYGSFSIPFIGDINGKNDGWDGNAYSLKLPEICILGGAMYINRVDANNGRSGLFFHKLSGEDLRKGATTGNTGTGWDNDEIKNTSRRFNRVKEVKESGFSGHIIGLTYDKSYSLPEEKLRISWAMEHSDRSNNTGITLFDFDNNGTSDLCYRDETTMRVISPALGTNNGANKGSDYTVYNAEPVGTAGTNPKDEAIMFKTACFSGTGFEYPTIADVNMDGSADIVTTSTWYNLYSVSRVTGSVRVFEYSGKKWAPCPPVWNQSMYDPTQVREDLKINPRPISMLTGYRKNNETIYPLNGSWIQQPIVREDQEYKPIVRQPDAMIADMKVSVASSSKTVVTLTIKNKGTASIGENSPITFYDGGIAGSGGLPIAGSTYISAQKVGVDIFPGETVVIDYTLGSINLNNHLIWARLLDDQATFPASGYDDCDLTNNDASGADCPYLYYSIDAPDSLICTGGGRVILTAVPKKTPEANIVISYQWYFGGLPIPGATSKTYRAEKAGEYTCFVTEDICRMFTSVKRLAWTNKVAYDDNITIHSYSPLPIYVMNNDQIPASCSRTLFPQTSFVTQKGTVQYDPAGHFVYRMNQGETGQDSFDYWLDADQGLVKATVTIRLNSLPDNVIDATTLCTLNPPPTMNAWAISEFAHSNTNLYSSLQTPLVGDLDGDGLPEIVLADIDANSMTNGIRILNSKTLEEKQRIALNASVPAAISPITAVGRVKINAVSDAPLIIVADGRYLYAYRYDPTLPGLGAYLWKSSDMYHNLAKNQGVAVQLIDLDGDGYSEIVANNRVFAAENGLLIRDLCNDGAGDGFIAPWTAAGSTTGASENGFLQTIAGETFGDFKHWIHIGNKAFRLENLGNGGLPRTTTSSATLAEIKVMEHGDLMSGVAANSTFRTIDANDLKNGTTQIADFDGDGVPDIVVASRNDNGGKFFIYVWSPQPTGGKLLAYYEQDCYRHGIPSIGDLDGNGSPNIVLMTGKSTNEAANAADKIIALKYDRKNTAPQELTTLWSKRFADNLSSVTALPIFDFDQDGKSEIVFNDYLYTHILDGATGNIRATSPLRNSKAGYGYPVIADVNGDGAAEIVTVGSSSSSLVSTLTRTGGEVRVFRSLGKMNWAPARPVWNMYSYSPVSVNADLTVPGIVFNPGTKFAPGDVQPFNGFMQQATLLNPDGTPIWLAPKAVFDGLSEYEYDSDSKTMTVIFKIKNTGSATFTSPLRSTFYRNTVGDRTHYQILDNEMLAPGETHTVRADIKNFDTWMPFNELILKINNAGLAGPDQAVCDALSLEESINPPIAFPDLDAIFMNEKSTVAIHDNDRIPQLCPFFSTDTVPTFGPKHGKLKIDNYDPAKLLFIYTPDIGRYGLDSIRYRTHCGNEYSTATVRYLVSKPLSRQYAACKGVKMTMGFAAVAGIEYRWYNAATGGTLIATANTLSVVKGSREDIGTWYVEPVWPATGRQFARIVVALEDGVCDVENPKGCAVTGTLLFNEDFGGNSYNDPVRSSKPLPSGTTTYTFVPNGGQNTYIDGTYGLMKNSDKLNSNGNWYTFYDHTHPNENNLGYFMLINADDQPGKFYERTIKSLCPNLKLYFSAMVGNLIKNGTNLVKPALRFLVQDAATLETLAEYKTGDIPESKNSRAEWKHYGFNFTTLTTASIILSIFNENPGGNGNDLVLDDIEIRLCVGEILVNVPRGNDTLLCEGARLKLQGEYFDNGVYGPNVISGWIYSSTGDYSDPNAWKAISDAIQPGPATEFSIEFRKTWEGYYRFIAATYEMGFHQSIYSCIAMSRVIHVESVTAGVPSDIRLQVKSASGMKVPLTSYTDSLDYSAKIEWTPHSAFIAGTANSTGILDVGNWVYPYTGTYNYKLTTAGCGEMSAKAYVALLPPNAAYNKTETVRICKSLATSKMLNLSKIAGITASGGVWHCDNPADGICTSPAYKPVIGTTGNHTGAVFFDAVHAATLAGAAYDYSDNGNPVKKFEFTYKAGTGTTLTTKKLILLVGD